jgi:hypothetical protein
LIHLSDCTLIVMAWALHGSRVFSTKQAVARDRHWP